MATSEDDRMAYLAGEGAERVPAQERAALDELRTLLQSPATWEQPDPDLEDRVVAAIAGEAASAAPSSVPARAPRKPAGRRLAWLRPAYGFGAAAVAAVAIAVAVIASTGSTSKPPLRFAMVLSGTGLAPAAHGSATLTKTASGWRIELHAGGLPHLEKGRYYQAWVKNAAGVLVPVGTFNDARNVTLWAGVPITEYRALSVTRQLANGNPASSGQRVLIGTITSKQ